MRVAAAILLTFALCWLSAAFGFVIGGTISGLPLLIGVVGGALYLALAPFARPATPSTNPGGARAVQLGAYALILLGALAITTPLRDLSWDGNAYHLDALKQLIAGWNPFRVAGPPGSEFSEWLAYFTKGPWYTTASAAMLTGSIDAAKFSSIALVVPAGLVGWALFGPGGADPLAEAWLRRPGLRALFGLVCALLWALSPIALVQLFTKYVDGQLGALTAVVAGALLLPRSARRGLDWTIVFGSAIVLLINVKLTGALITGFLVGGMLIGDVALRALPRLIGNRAPRSTGPAFDRSLWGTAIAAGLIALFIGWNPYVTQYARNTIAHRAPFYPTDYAALTHLDYNLPPSMRDKNALLKGVLSTFSATEANVAHAYQLKVPFTVTLYELTQFSAPDSRFGGFGPWWSGVVILCVAVLVLGWGRVPGRSWAMLGLLSASVLVNPELWWARYVAQAWLIPIVILFFTLRRASADQPERPPVQQRPLTLAQMALLAALVGNVLLVAIPAVVSQINGNLTG